MQFVTLCRICKAAVHIRCKKGSRFFILQYTWGYENKILVNTLVRTKENDYLTVLFSSQALKCL